MPLWSAASWRLHQGGPAAHTGQVTTTPHAVPFTRSGPGIRAALAQWAPDECQQFEAEFQQALSAAGTTFSLVDAEAVIDRWWRIAVIRAQPLNAEEQEQLRRARSGDFPGLLVQAEDGSFRRLDA